MKLVSHPCIAVQFIQIGGNDPLKGVSNHHKLHRLGHELFVQVLAEEGVLVPEEGVQSHSVVLGDQMIWHVCKLEKGMKPRGGGCFWHLSDRIWSEECKTRFPRLYKTISLAGVLGLLRLFIGPLAFQLRNYGIACVQMKYHKYC